MKEVKVIYPSPEDVLVVSRETSTVTSTTRIDIHTPPLNTGANTHSSVKITQTSTCMEHKIHSPNVVLKGDDLSGRDSQPLDGQTDAVVRKESQETEIHSISSIKVKSGADTPVQVSITQDKAATKDTVTTPTPHRTLGSTPDEIDLSRIKENMETDPTSNTKEPEKTYPTVNKLDSPVLFVLESPIAETVITRQDSVGSPTPVLETHPSPEGEASPLKESPLPSGQICNEELSNSDLNPCQNDDTTEPLEELLSQSLPSLPQSQPSLPQSQPSLLPQPASPPTTIISTIISTTTTTTTTSAVVALKPASPPPSPTPPQDTHQPPTPTKETQDTHTSSHTLWETQPINSTQHETLPKTPRSSSPQKEHVKVTPDNNIEISASKDLLKKKIKMSPFLKIIHVLVDPPIQDNEDREDTVDNGSILPIEEEKCLIGSDSQVERNPDLSKNPVSSNESDKIDHDLDIDVLRTTTKENRPRGKSDIKQLEYPYQNQDQLNTHKRMPEKDDKRRRSRTHKRAGTEGEEACYPSLRKLGDATPGRLSNGKNTSKRKLFDPTAQSHMKILQAPQVQEAEPKALEGEEDVSFYVERKTYPADHTAEHHSTRKRHRVLTSLADRSTRRNSLGRGKAKGKQPLSQPQSRRQSGFMEDSALEESQSIYSDIDSSLGGEVDSWFIQRIEKIKYKGLTYYNKSSRKSVQNEEGDQKAKKRKYITKDAKHKSLNNTMASFDLEGLSDGETMQKSSKRTLFNSITPTDSTEQVNSYSSAISSNKRKALPSCVELPPKTSSTSEVSQNSSHDEWEPPSNKKKKSFTKKRREQPKQTATKNKGRGRQESRLKDGSCLHESGQHNTTTDSYILTEHSNLMESSVEILRHTSRSSVDSSSSAFMTFKLVAPKDKQADNTKMDSVKDENQPSTQPQESQDEVTPAVQYSPIKSPSSTPVLYLPSPALQVLSQSPQIHSLNQKFELYTQPATLDPQTDTDTNQHHNQTPDIAHHLNTSASVVKRTLAETQPFYYENSPDLFVLHHPSETLNTIDISAIHRPDSDTQEAPLGPLQSTMLNSPINKSKSPAPKFIYVSQPEVSYVNKELEKLAVVGGEDSGALDSPSSCDPIKAELRYNKDQTPLLVTITTTADIHQSDASPPNHTTQQHSPHSITTTILHTQPHKAATTEPQKQERPQINTKRIQPSLIHPVTPTAKVPPQSAGTPIYGSKPSSRMYRQLTQDHHHHTPLSSRHVSVSVV